MSTYTDNFTGASGTLPTHDANWVAGVTGISVDGLGEAYPIGDDGRSYFVYNGLSVGGYNSASVFVTTYQGSVSIGGYCEVGVIVRSTVSGGVVQSCYRAIVGTYNDSTSYTQINLEKGSPGGGFTLLTNTSISPNSSFTLELIASGSDLTVKYNGASILTYTDSTYQTGQVGICGGLTAGDTIWTATSWTGETISVDPNIYLIYDW